MNAELLAVVEDLFSTSPVTAGIPLQLVHQLIYQEGLETEAYQDSLGHWTIGVGHTPAYAGEVWSVQKCISVLFQDIQAKGIQPVDANLPWARSAGETRWAVVVNMAFNMGIGRLLEFSATLSAFRAGDWAGVVQGMRESLWWSQVGERARELAYQVYFDEWVTEGLTEQQNQALLRV